MSVKTALAKYGSGVGRIYLTYSNDVIFRNLPNNEDGRKYAETQMLLSSPLISEISATSVVTVTAAGGDITSLSYNGVQTFDIASPVTGATTEDLATNLASAINSHLSVPEYTAVASGSSVTVYLDASLGDSLNGTAAAFSTTGTATMTGEDLDGGSYPTGDVDTQIGFKMYLNPELSAPIGSLVGATDVTSGVLRKSSASPYDIREVEISSDSVEIDRDGAVTVVSIQTEGAVAADDLTSIDAGIFTEGDTIIIRGQESGKVTTVKEGGNIELSNGANFLTGDKDSALVLQYSTSDNKWYEINRSPGNDLSISSLRSAGVALPTQGVETVTVNTSGESVTLTAGTDKGYYNLIGTGTLTGSVSYALAAGLVDGDTFYIDYNATITLSGFTVTLAGVSLTDAQALGGNVLVKAVWDATNTNWVISILRDTQAVDLVDTTELATKEDDLGNPASDGQVLSSTTGGVRTWVDRSKEVYLVSRLNTLTSDNTGTDFEVGFLTIPLGLLANDGDFIDFIHYGTTAANVNNKTIKLKWDNSDVLLDSSTLVAAPNARNWTIKSCLTRISNTSFKFITTIDFGAGDTQITYTSLAGLDFDNTQYKLSFVTNTTVAADVTIYSSNAKNILQ